MSGILKLVERLMYPGKLLLSPATDLLSTVWFVASRSLNFKQAVWPGECSWGLWPFCYFCCHALSDVCKWRTWPLSPASPQHEKFTPTPLFKPFLMKSTQKRNWLMPNEYHWITVIVRLMFVTLKLFIKHQFHFKSACAMKCAATPLGFPIYYQPKPEQWQTQGCSPVI